jgi:hypothetical protein
VRSSPCYPPAADSRPDVPSLLSAVPYIERSGLLEVRENTEYVSVSDPHTAISVSGPLGQHLDNLYMLFYSSLSITLVRKVIIGKPNAKPGFIVSKKSISSSKGVPRRWLHVII